MEQKFNLRPVSVPQSSSILGFELDAGVRYLTIEGRRAYDMGSICDTCEFIFERLEGAVQKVSPEGVSQQLRSGLKAIHDSVVGPVSLILPVGEYLVSLLQVNPTIVKLGSELDYFTNEQRELWGIDSFWDLPNHPKVEYYRTRSKEFGQREALFEFLIPMYPASWLEPETVRWYEDRLNRGERPTALSLSVLDVRQPIEGWPAAPKPHTHWCFAHYLIDGHHKTFAASATRKPITLLSFLALKQCVASADQTSTVFEIL